MDAEVQEWWKTEKIFWQYDLLWKDPKSSIRLLWEALKVGSIKRLDTEERQIQMMEEYYYF